MVNQVVTCLTDIKYTMIRFLLIRTEFDKYFSNGFDELKQVAL